MFVIFFLIIKYILLYIYFMSQWIDTDMFLFYLFFLSIFYYKFLACRRGSMLTCLLCFYFFFILVLLYISCMSSWSWIYVDMFEYVYFLYHFNFTLHIFHVVMNQCCMFVVLIVFIITVFLYISYMYMILFCF